MTVCTTLHSFLKHDFMTSCFRLDEDDVVAAVEDQAAAEDAASNVQKLRTYDISIHYDAHYSVLLCFWFCS